jgi:uncharacterized protein
MPKKMKNENLLLQQIFSIPVDKDKYMVYAPLKGIAFIANSLIVNAIFDYCQHISAPTRSTPIFSQNTDNKKKDLQNFLGFLHRVNFFQREPIPVDEYHEKGILYDAVILFLTNQCNLRCIYCYASSGEYPNKQMNWEIAKAAIDHVTKEILNNGLNALTLGFHGGGEPTLNWNIFAKATNYAISLAEKNNILINLTGSFNGYWSKRTLNYILNNFTDISLSYDGLPAIQNFQRPNIDEQGSSPRVINSLNALDKSDISYGIRMTVTNESVHYLTESISFICENFRPKKIQVEPVFEEGRAKIKGSHIRDLNVFIEQFVRGLKKAEEHGIVLFYSGARPEILTRRFCLAACRALIVTPEGDVTTCFETYGRDHPLSSQFIVGHYKGNGQFAFDNKKLGEHFSHGVEGISYCDACFCKWHCAGDCTIKTCYQGITGRFEPTERCYLNRELTKYLLLKNIKESDGLIWVNKHERC